MQSQTVFWNLAKSFLKFKLKKYHEMFCFVFEVFSFNIIVSNIILKHRPPGTQNFLKYRNIEISLAVPAIFENEKIRKLLKLIFWKIGHFKSSKGKTLWNRQF